MSSKRSLASGNYFYQFGIVCILINYLLLYLFSNCSKNVGLFTEISDVANCWSMPTQTIVLLLN